MSNLSRNCFFKKVVTREPTIYINVEPELYERLPDGSKWYDTDDPLTIRQIRHLYPDDELLILEVRMQQFKKTDPLVVTLNLIDPSDGSSIVLWRHARAVWYWEHDTQTASMMRDFNHWFESVDWYCTCKCNTKKEPEEREVIKVKQVREKANYKGVFSMRYLWAISLAIVCQSVLAVDIFGTDYFLRDSFVRVIDDERGTSIVLDTDIFFDEPGSNDLDAEQYETLEKVARLVNQHSDAYLSITGHTDDVYSQQVRYEISDAQARRIADFLVDYGVDPNRIREVTGEGDLWPIADNDTQERRHINRRVEITFLRKPPAKVVRHEGTRYEKREVIEVEVERKLRRN